LSDITEGKDILYKKIIKVSDEVQKILTNAHSTPLKEAARAYDLLKRPKISFYVIEQFIEVQPFGDEVKEKINIKINYQEYNNKANEQVGKMLKMENKKIPHNIDYDAIDSIAFEAKEKLKKIKPISIGQASRIAGVNPADISILLVYIEQGSIKRTAE